MKTGLLSMQRVNNYGSFWQAYCLKKMIENEENQVEFIDIIPGKLETRTSYKREFSFSKIKRIPYYLFQKNKNRMFAEVQKAILECTDMPNYKEEYDAIIIGSDEVFNFVQKSPWGFSSQLYGAINNRNVSTYAACFGCTTLKDIEEYHVKEEITKAFSNLKNISVRDENSYQIVKELSGEEPQVHLDPVLVGELPLENMEERREPYILVYSYDFRFADQIVIEQVKRIAKEEKCKIYSVGFYQNWCDKNILVSPIELLKYFMNAEYVVTDTFHGTIFSLRCHKKFITLIRDSNKQKLEDLLRRVGLEERIVTEKSNIKEVLYSDIDYDSFEAMRKQEYERSKKYIQSCIGIDR